MPDSNPVHSSLIASRRSPAIAPLQLRVIGTQRHGQIVEVDTPRCTVGSAQDCAVRLRAAGVRPLHCVILRGLDGFAIRSLGADTFLNGRAFREQSLRAGDRLRFGPIEFEVLGEAVPPIARPEEAEQPRLPAKPAPRDIPIWTAGESNRSADVLTRLQRLEQQLIDCRRTDDETDPEPASDSRSSPQLPPAVANECVATDSDTAQEANVSFPERSPWEEQLAERAAELLAAQELLAQRTSHWEETHRHLQAERDGLRADLDHQLTEMADRCEGFRTEVARLTAELQLERQNLESARHAWSTDCENLESQRRSLSRLHADSEERSRAERMQFDHERENWSNELSALQGSLNEQGQRNEELENEAKLLHQRYEQLNSRFEELEVRLIQSTVIKTSPAAGNQTCADIPVPFPPDSNLWKSSRAPIERSELTWLAQQFAATQETEPKETELLTDTSLSPVNDATLSGEPLTLSDQLVTSSATDVETPASDPDANTVTTAIEETPLPTPQFAVRFLAFWQPPAELVDSIPVNEPPSTKLGEVPLVPEIVGLSEPDQKNENETGVSPDITDHDTEPTSTNVESDVFDRLQRAGIWRDREEGPEPEEATANDSSGQNTAVALPDCPLPAPSDCTPPVEQVDGIVSSDEMPKGENSGSTEVNGTARPSWIDRSGATCATVGLPSSAENTDGQATRDTPPKSMDEAPNSDASSASQGAAIEVEDSIETYMHRLMERMRGSDVAGTSAYVPPLWEERAPITEMETPTETKSDVSDEVPAITAENYLPRRHAPESNVNLSAMRQLANDSRQRNIRSHARRTWTAESAGKLLSAFAAFAVAFASFFLTDIHPRFAAIGLVGGLGIGVFCVWQALSLRLRLSLSLRSEKDDDLAEENALDSAEAVADPRLESKFDEDSKSS